MRRLLLFLLPLLLLVLTVAGCGVLEPGTFVLGPPEVPTVRLAATLDTGALSVEGCDSAPARAGGTDPAPGGCRFGVHLGALPLLDAHTAEDAAARLQGMPMDAVRTVSLVVRSVSLAEGEVPLALDDLGARVRLAVGEVDLVDGLPAERLAERPVRVVVPEPLRLAFAGALTTGEPLMASVAVELEVPTDSIDDLPEALDLVVVLQPEIEVVTSDVATRTLGR